MKFVSRVSHLTPCPITAKWEHEEPMPWPNYPPPGYAHFLHEQLVDFRFALGAVAPTVLRLSEAEELAMQDATEEQILEAADKVIRPIDDQRSTAAYRKQVALNSLQEFLRQTRAAIESTNT